MAEISGKGGQEGPVASGGDNRRIGSPIAIIITGHGDARQIGELLERVTAARHQPNPLAARREHRISFAIAIIIADHRLVARPRFPEDMARAIALKLWLDKHIVWFQVESENLESIHNHNACALVASARIPSAPR